MKGYMMENPTMINVDRRNAGPALALSAALAGRMSTEKMQKIIAVHLTRRKKEDSCELEASALVKVQVTPKGNPLEFTEPLDEFPSETMLAQIMLVV
jgi:hypothetical protein